MQDQNIVTLIIPDLHCPYHHRDAFKFLAEVNKWYQPTQVFLTGDEIDNHAISFHDKDPDSPFSPIKELEESIIYMYNLYKMFPVAKVCNSNHGSLLYRKAKVHGLSRAFIKPWNEILEAPAGWSWHDSITFNAGGGVKVMMKHGTGTPKNALLTAQRQGTCYVQGHHHTTAMIYYFMTEGGRMLWGLTAGCLIDHEKFAFAYQRENILKPWLGVAVIINGVPFLIPMTLNSKGRWTGRLY